MADGNETPLQAQARPHYRRRVLWILIGIPTVAALWIMYLPAQFYEAYCTPEDRRELREYYGTHLSKYYRESLKANLRGGNILFIEIGDRVLVPFVDPGYLDERMGGIPRLMEFMFGYGEESWSLTNWKVANDSLFGYSRKYPDSEITKMRDRLFAEFFGGTRLPNEEEERLWCDLTKRIVDPNLK